MNPNDPATFWLLIAICIVLLFAWICRETHRVLQLPREQRLRVEAQRLMLRFCKAPTRENCDAAWNFIHANDVRLGDLDWSLVQRFTRVSLASDGGKEGCA